MNKSTAFMELTEQLSRANEGLKTTIEAMRLANLVAEDAGVGATSRDRLDAWHIHTQDLAHEGRGLNLNGE